MASRWWTKDTVAVVTGGNKGIGFEIVRGLAKNNVTTVLTARDAGRGQEAIGALNKQGLNSVVFHQLDVTSADSIEAFATWLKGKFGGIDILINNAAIYAGTEVTYQNAQATLDTNYYGVKNVTNKLLPLLRPGGRILNVSSGLGQLINYGLDSNLGKALVDEANLTEESVDSYAEKWVEDVKSGRWKEEGWSPRFVNYQDSKLLLNAYTRAFTKVLSKRPEGQELYVNCMCPGHCATDLNSHSGHLTAEQGADTAVWLALLPKEDYPQGGYWRTRAPLAF